MAGKGDRSKQNKEVANRSKSEYKVEKDRETQQVRDSAWGRGNPDVPPGGVR